MEGAKGPQNLAVLRYIALNLRKHGLTTKLGIEAQRFKIYVVKSVCSETSGFKCNYPARPRYISQIYGTIRYNATVRG